MEENKFQREVLDRLVRLETKIDLQDYKGLSEKSDLALSKSKRNEEEIKENKEEIEKIRASIKWVVISIIGAFLVALINILVNYGWKV